MRSHKKQAPLTADVMEAPAEFEVIPAYLTDKSITLPREQWLVSGQPIPSHMEHLVTWQQTDQGIAQAKHGKPIAHTSVVTDAWDNKMLQRANATQVWESNDPMLEAVDRVREPGMSYKFLGKKIIDRRGSRGFELVKAPNGENVSVGNMLLGKMPIESKIRRNEFYRKQGEEASANAEQQFKSDLEKAVRDSGSGDVSALRPNEILHDFRTPNRGIETGVTSTRGSVDRAA